MLTDDDRNHLLSIADAVASLHAVDGGLRRDHCLAAAERLRAIAAPRVATVGGCPMFPTPPVHEEEPRDECPGCVAPADCHAHRVDWRARAIAAEIRAEEAEAHGAKSDALIDAICQRVGARDTGCGGQTVEACEMRRRMNMTQRIDMLTTAAARWAKVAPLIERLRHTRRHAKPDIVVTALDNLLAATEDAP